jgi:hypothetical protein
MSDDYHDDDSRSGGLWDPDAHTPPPPVHERPTLRVIESNDRTDQAASATLVAGNAETLVRLDQFRPADLHETSFGRRVRHRRAAALLAAVLMIAAIALAGIKFSPNGEHQAPRTQANTLSTDAEQAALVRKVAPHPTATTRRHRIHRTNANTKQGDAKKGSSKPRATTSVATTQVRSAPSSATQQPSNSTVASKPKRKLRQYDAVSSDTTTPELHQPVAASEFGFEP